MPEGADGERLAKFLARLAGLLGEPAESESHGQQSDLSIDELGAIAVGLAYHWSSWIDRREHIIEFIEDTALRRTTRIAFTLPEVAQLAATVAPGALIYVPLQILAKRTLINSQIRDENGTVFPPLNTQQNGEVAGHGLVAMFEAFVDEAGLRLDDQTAASLRRLAANPALSKPILDEVLSPAGALGWALKIGSDDEAPEAMLIRDLAEGFLQLVQIPYEPGRPREFTASDEIGQPDWPRDPRVLAAMAVRLGGAPINAKLGPFPIGHAPSTHFEVVAPAEMEIIAAELHGKQYDTRDEPVRRRARRAYYRRQRWLQFDPQAAKDPRRLPIPSKVDADSALTPFADLAHAHAQLRQRVHLHRRLLAGSEVADPARRSGESAANYAQRRADARQEQIAQQALGRNDTATLQLALMPRRSGPVSAVTLTATLTAAALVIFATRLRDLDGQTSAAVLLLGPAIVAAYLARAGEHPYTTRALRGVRNAAILSALLAIGLAMLIAGNMLTKPAPTAAAPKPTSPPHASVCVARVKVPTVRAAARGGAGKGRGGANRIPITLTCPSQVSTAPLVTPVPRAPKELRSGVNAAGWIIAIAAAMLAALLILMFWLGSVVRRYLPAAGDLPDAEFFEDPPEQPAST